MFCALRQVFTAMDESEQSLVSSAPLREALSAAFGGTEFAIKKQADAAEAMEGLLTVLHTVLAKPANQAGAGGPVLDCPCVVHQTLAVVASHHIVCPGGVARPKITKKHKKHCHPCAVGRSRRVTIIPPYPEYVKYVPSYSLIAMQRVEPLAPFDALLGMVIHGESAARSCPDCEATGLLDVHRLVRLPLPPIAMIGVGWSSDKADPVLAIAPLLDIVDRYVNLTVIHGIDDGKSRPAVLRGMFCYYGRHYIALFYNQTLGSWLFMDDSRVEHLGEDWEV